MCVCLYLHVALTRTIEFSFCDYKKKSKGRNKKGNLYSIANKFPEGKVSDIGGFK